MPDEEDNQVYLSSQHVRQWMTEYSEAIDARIGLQTQANEIQQKVNELTTKIQALGTKLKSAMPFEPKIAEWMTEREFDATENIPLTNAILRGLFRIPLGQFVQRNQIHSLVQQVGYPLQKLQANQNYLYIALKRLTDRKLIVEQQNGYFAITETGRHEVAKK